MSVRAAAGARLTARAPGKTNLGLFLGPSRPDGRHELVSLIEPLSLADELTLGAADPGATQDEVRCPGVEGPNLAAAALAAYRAATGWDAPPQRLDIVKRVPVAAGMGGGSGDAAAALRLAAAAAGRPGDPLLRELAPRLGADVPGQLVGAPVLVAGAGELVEPVAPPPAHAVLVLPAGASLSTADVYREADRLGLARPARDLLACAGAIRAALAAGDGLRADLLVNDLEPAARALFPAIDGLLADARAAGAAHAFVSGSGPTVIGLFPGAEGAAAAAAAARELRSRHPRAVAAEPVGDAFAAPRVLEGSPA